MKELVQYFQHGQLTLDQGIRFVSQTHVQVQGFPKLTNLVAISQRSWRPLLTFKAGCVGNNGKNWLLNPGTSSQSEGYSSKMAHLASV